MTRNYIGVDISKDWLDIHDPKRGERRIENTAPAIGNWLKRLDHEAFLVLEATSHYDRLLRETSEAAGILFARVNPVRTWHHAKTYDLAKTDRVDARMLADFGRKHTPEPTPPTDPARAELGLLAQRRDQLLRMQTQEKNRLAATTHTLVQKDIRASLRTLAGRIERIERAIHEHLAANPELSAQARLLCTIPGVGHLTAVELLAHLPQLGEIKRRSIAKLGGLAPRSNDSGRHEGKRYLFPGKRHIRKALYMAALSGLRHPHLFGGMAKRLREEKKPGKVIAMALARKILTIANAILKSGEPFKAN